LRVSSFESIPKLVTKSGGSKPETRNLKLPISC
jgi:hypothetical protein